MHCSTVSLWDSIAELWESHHSGCIKPALVPGDFSSELMLSGIPAVTATVELLWSKALMNL